MTEKTARGRALPSPSARPGPANASEKPVGVPYAACVPDQLSAAVAREVRRLLEERGMSGNALAKATGIPQTSIAGKLRGASAFTVDELDAVGRALEVKASELLEWAQRS